MASSNVEYYQRQKELQDVLHVNEQRRLKLDQQLQTYCKSDQRLAKLRASKLQSHWNKICEDARISKERNERIKKDLEQIEAHVTNLSVKREKLKLLKKHYEDFIDRAYPQWHEQVLQWKQQQQGETTAQYQSSAARQQPEHSPGQKIRVPRDQTSTSSIRQSPQQPHRHTPATSEQQSPQRSRPPATMVQQTPQKDRQHFDGPMAQRSDELSTEHETNDEDRIAQPVQSVKVERLDNQGTRKMEHVIQPTSAMNPTDEEDEEISDFGEDISLPVSGRAAPTPLHQEERQRAMDIQQDFSSSNSPPGSPAKSGDFASGTYTVPRPNTPRPELSVEGLLLLFAHVENDFENALSLEGYYRSTRPSTAQRSDIIHKANNGDDLSQMDAELVSMVILDQLTPVIGNHGCGFILTDSLLNANTSYINDVRAYIPEDFHSIWDRMFEHFQQLVQNKVMNTHEVAGVFAPSLVEAGSSCADKAYALVVQLLDRATGDGATDTSGNVSPRDADGGDSQMGTARSSLTPGGGVPALMLGSLVDKPFSDEESSLLQSTSREPQIPLNETDAYRSMMFGTLANQKSHIQDDDDDDTDEDVEKQVASAITPRTPTDNKAGMGRGIAGSTASGRVGSTGDTSGRGSRKPIQPVQIGSDLDTDTENYMPVSKQQQEGEIVDDDFYEFYG